MLVAITARKSCRDRERRPNGSDVTVTKAGFLRTTRRIMEGNAFASTIRVPWLASQPSHAIPTPCWMNTPKPYTPRPRSRRDCRTGHRNPRTAVGAHVNPPKLQTAPQLPLSTCGSTAGRRPRRSHGGASAFAWKEKSRSRNRSRRQATVSAAHHAGPRSRQAGAAPAHRYLCRSATVLAAVGAPLTAISMAGRRGVARAELRGPQAAPSLAPIRSAASAQPSQQTSAPTRRRRRSKFCNRAGGGARWATGTIARLRTRSLRPDRGVIAIDGEHSRAAAGQRDRFAYRSSWLLPRPPPGEGFALPAPRCGGPIVDQPLSAVVRCRKRQQDVAPC